MLVGPQAKIDMAVEARLKAQSAAEHYKKKMADERATVTKLKEDAEVVETTFQEWTAKASEYCERFENPRGPDEVKRLLDSVQKALEDRRKKCVQLFIGVCLTGVNVCMAGMAHLSRR